jgi:type II secretion system protein G
VEEVLNFFRKKSKKRKGFTLIELMIVIAIIGVLAAIAVPNFSAARRKARAKACIANMKLLENALQQYDMDNPPGSNAGANATTSVCPNGSPVSTTQFSLAQSGYVQKDPACPVLAQTTSYSVARRGATQGYAIYVFCRYHQSIDYAMKIK